MLFSVHVIRSRKAILRHYLRTGRPTLRWFAHRYAQDDNGARSAWMTSIERTAAQARPGQAAKLRPIFWNWLYVSYPEINHGWSRRAHWRGHAFYQDDGLIDLQRIPYPNVYFHYAAVPRRYQVSSGPIAFATRPQVERVGQLGTSQWRMRRGWPAIAPDGTPIAVCRLLDYPGAAYVELPKSMATDIIVNLGRSQLTQHCLSGVQSRQYWRWRIGFLLTRYGRELHPKSRNVHIPMG